MGEITELTKYIHTSDKVNLRENEPNLQLEYRNTSNLTQGKELRTKLSSLSKNYLL